MNRGWGPHLARALQGHLGPAIPETRKESEMKTLVSSMAVLSCILAHAPRLLADANMITAETLADAAKKAVAASTAR